MTRHDLKRVFPQAVFLWALGELVPQFGNEWAAAGAGLRFCLYVHHTDAEREWAYDRKSLIGKLDKGLDEAKVGGWTVVSMKDDWKTISPKKSGCSFLTGKSKARLVFVGDWAISQLWLFWGGSDHWRYVWRCDLPVHRW